MTESEPALPQRWVKEPLSSLLTEIKNGTSARQNTQREGLPVTRIETISETPKVPEPQAFSC